MALEQQEHGIGVAASTHIKGPEDRLRKQIYVCDGGGIQTVGGKREHL